jgi:hypothetical protein
MKQTFLTIIAVFLTAFSLSAGKIQSGVTWFATNGDTLHAHAGDVTKVGSTWYWIGAAPRIPGGNFGLFGGFNCYSSTDLATWKFERMVLPPVGGTGYLSSGRVAYDPHIIYNSTTRKYVMVAAEYDGSTSYFVWATSDSINGIYTFANASPGANNTVVGDAMAYKDDDGSAYVLYSAANNGIAIDRLSSDYLSISSRIAYFAGSACHEAQCLLKVSGTYYLYSSWCAYWSATQGHYFTASNLAGPWIGPQNLGDANTYNSQGTAFITVQGNSATTWIYAADRWNCATNDCDLKASTYVWLPLTVNNGTLSLSWYANWYIDPTTGQWDTSPVNTVAAPAFNPPAGSYTGTQSVTITCATSGATIRYTLDGTTPTASSPIHDGPISVAATATIKARAFKTGMTESDIAVAAIQILPPGADYSIFANQTPALVDMADGAHELGMKFQSSAAGIITAVRYYRSPAETGAHTGRIWSSTGAQLASVTFTNETASGWQQAMLSSPLSITASTVYVVSVNTNVDYVATNDALAAPIVNGPVSSVADGANGVYAAMGLFPNQSYRNTNYFRDIVFRQGQATVASAGRFCGIARPIARAAYYDVRGKRLAVAGKCARGIRIISDGWRILPAME